MSHYSTQALKLLLACIGPGILFYAINLFDKYHALGTDLRDAAHSVALNNHGVVKYVTETQYETFRFFLVIGIVLVVIFIGTIAFLMRARRYR